MRVIVPTVVTDAMLLSSSAPETDYAAYAAGTTYALGARVIRTSTHRIYESLAASNLGNTPELSPLKWLDIGPTNRWACFDRVIGTATVLAGALTVVLAPQKIDALALLELVGASVTVSITSASVGGAVVYSRSVSLDAAVILDYYDYCFAPIVQQTSVVLTDLPPYADAVVTITLSGSQVQLGLLSVGMAASLGGAQYGATSGITDYSVKTVDAFGGTTLVKRAYSKRPSYRLWLGKAEGGRAFRTLTDLRATPCVWIGSDDPSYAELLVTYGFYKSFQAEIAYPTRTLFTLEIEGMT